MKKQILRTFKEFIDSDEGKGISKQKNRLGGKLRLYKKRFKEDILTEKAALLVLIDCKVVDEIKFKEFT